METCRIQQEGGMSGRTQGWVRRILALSRIDRKASRKTGISISTKKSVCTLLLALLFLAPVWGNGQAGQDLPFAPGEKLNYSIRYKWGLLMVRAGSANYSVAATTYKSAPAHKFSLSFRTSSGFDRIFKIRDVLHSYANMNMEPLFHQKSLSEGSTQYNEEMTFLRFGATKTQARSVRKNLDGSVRFDKSLEANGMAYDMVNLFTLARTLDYASLTSGKSISLSSFIGRDVVQMRAHYRGQTVIEKGKEKYKALKFDIDVVDEAFDTSEKAVEIWISDDQNRIPLRIKAKLKIGAAEAELSSSSGLKHPFTSKVSTK